MTSNESADVPDQVHFIVPRIDVEHRADACHVVSMVASVFNVLVPDGHTGKQLKVFRRLLAYFFSSVEPIHK